MVEILMVTIAAVIAFLIFQYTLLRLISDQLPNMSIRRDEQNLIHCSDGPAIIFDDIKFNRYFWHAIEIPKIWIEEPGYLTVFLALSQENIERRRAACEIVGWNKILDRINCETIDRDDDAEIGELIEAFVPGMGTQRFLRVRCGTGRTFVLSVPPEIDTALAANAWTYDIDPQTFRPEIRT